MKKKTALKVTGGVVAILAVCGIGMAIKPAIAGDAEKNTSATPLSETAVEIEAEEQLEEAKPEATEAQETANSADTTKPEEAQEVDSSQVRIELSGKHEDTFTTTMECYVESDKVVIYLPEGATINGDILQVTEKVMSDLSETTGLNFNKNIEPDGYTDIKSLYYNEPLFEEVNKDNSKINIFVTHDSYPCAYENTVVVNIEDYDFEALSYQTLYHELAHVLHFRNGVRLGSVMEEGYATYISYVSAMEHGIPAWNTIQYFMPAEEYVSPIIAGGKDSFLYQMDDKDSNYHYGFRFVWYLTETYGEDIVEKMMVEAGRRGFSPAITMGKEEETFNRNNELLKEIIISQTSETVFEDFAAWNSANWSTVGYQGYLDLEAMSSN